MAILNEPVTRGVILAAGRGSRLGDMTDNKSKGLIDLNGKPLVMRQIEVMRECGINEIAIVTGYNADAFEPYSSGLTVYYNKDWSTSTMLWTLLCARDFITDRVIVSYSDIVYESSFIEPLVRQRDDISIIYDPEWATLWRKRFTDPLSDAESFRLDHEGFVLNIGGKAETMAEIEGQYVGLFSINRSAVDDILSRFTEQELMRMDITALLGQLAERGVKIRAVAGTGKWCEIDTPKDLEVANEMVRSGELPN